MRDPDFLKLAFKGLLGLIGVRLSSSPGLLPRAAKRCVGSAFVLVLAGPKQGYERTGAPAVSGSAETVLLRDTFAVHRIRRAARDRLRARISAAPNTAKKRRRPVSSRTPLPKNTDALAARDG